MSNRNALPLVAEALEQKRVEIYLPGQKKKRDLFLMSVFGDQLDPLQDLHAMYSDIGQSVRDQVAVSLQQVNPDALRNHGICIEPGTLRIVNTFNMAFADLHREGGRLVRIPLDKVLSVADIPDYYGKPCRDGDPCFGPRAERVIKELGHIPEGKVVNLVESFKTALSRHMVSVRLPGEKDLQGLCLVKVWAKTDLLRDIEMCQPSSRPAQLFAQLNLQEPDVKFREYGVFITPDMQITFAFNTALADYNRVKEVVEYNPWPVSQGEDVFDKRLFEPKPFVRPRWSRSGIHGAIMYALPEPRE